VGSRVLARLGCVIAFAGCAAAPASVETKAEAMTQSRTEQAIELMTSFAERTGLTSQKAQRRYLWTDSFAVCNYLGLARTTGDERYEQLALGLVDRVHRVLGRHRSDDARTGWISGLTEHEGEERPTRGGLRIGKPLAERRPDDPFDERLEWDRDGQYFHYLTRWMHALDLVARATREPRYNLWARELAETAHDAFTYAPPGGGPVRMYWKMSIDLARPLVPSMGHHDPLDGLVTFVQLQATANGLERSPEAPKLAAGVADFIAMGEGADWATADPLGLGGLLMDACRVEQLEPSEAFSQDELFERLLSAALVGLQSSGLQSELRRPAATRPAFRELGLAIGLQAVERMWKAVEEQRGSSRGSPETRALLEDLMRYVSIRGEIEGFWLEPEHRRVETWTEHRDINEVMLATSLVSEGCLVLPPTD